MRKNNNLIKLGRFAEAFNFLNQFSEDEIYEIISSVGEEHNIASYSFICFLISKNDINLLNGYAISIIYGIMAYLKGAGPLSYSHHLRRLERDPENIDLIEYQIMFHECDDDTFRDPEIRTIAENVLLLRPESEAAQAILRWTSPLSEEPFTPLGEGLNPYERVKIFIEKGRFTWAFNEIPKISHDELLTILRTISSNKDITTYGFVWAMIYKKETSELHLVAAKIFMADFCHLNGAAAIVFFHTHRAAELEPDNLKIQEQLLSLYEPDNESFDLEETKTLVERVLKMNPDSEQGLRVLNLIG